MNLSIKPILEEATWESFLAKHSPHTFLQSWAWGEFQEKLGHPVFRLGIFKSETCVGQALLVLFRAKRGSYLLCPHGPTFDPTLDPSPLLQTFKTHLETLGKEQCCDFLRLAPLLLENSENERLFLDAGFRQAPIHAHAELAWILDIQKPDEEILSGMRKAHRYAIKHAPQEGISIRTSDRIEDLDIFWRVYQETVDRQHFTPFSKDFLQKELETFLPRNQALLFFGEYEGKVISTAIFVFTKDAGFYHHGASTRETTAKVNASCALQWQAIQEAKKRGCKWLNFFGIAPLDKPKHPWAGLTHFKTGFGGFSEAYVHAKDLPLTPKYWFNFCIETIRRIRRGF